MVRDAGRHDHPRATAAAGLPAGVAQASGPISERAFRRVAVGVTAVVVVVLVPQALLTGHARVISQVTAPLVASSMALVLAAVAVVRSQGTERRWRLLLAGALVSAVAGAVEWARLIWVDSRSAVGPGPADAAHLLTPVLVFLALLYLPSWPAGREAGARAPPRGTGLGLSQYVVVALDSLLIVGSMLLIAWVSLLDQVVRSGIVGLPFFLAMAYPLCGTALVVALVLLMTLRRTRNGRALALLTAGLIAITTTESMVVYLAVEGYFTVERTATSWIGLSLGPPLLALAMLAPQRRPRHSSRAGSARRETASLWGHVFLPYLPLSVAAVLVAWTAVRGEALSGITLDLSLLLAVLVTLRQVITLVQNSRLLVSNRAAQRRLHHQALHDPLTGLPNRAMFAAELRDAVDAHRGLGQPLVMLFCDLDDFKAVNDSLGHAVGDELLRAVAGRLRTAVRREDLAARLGGDEFAVLLRDSLEDPQHTAQGAVQRIQETMRAPFRVQGQRRQVRISIGSAIADASTPVDSPEELLHRADHAMYAAKDHNRRQNNRTRHRPVRSTAGDAP